VSDLLGRSAYLNAGIGQVVGRPSTVSPCGMTVVDATGRLLVAWYGGDRAAREDMTRAFRAAFPTHADASWRKADRCWSLPATGRNRDRLDAFIAAHIRPECVAWVGLHGPPGEGRGVA